jgi:hypothetical protein
MGWTDCGNDVPSLVRLAQVGSMPTDPGITHTYALAVHGMDFTVLDEEPAQAVSANKTRRSRDQNPIHSRNLAGPCNRLENGD